MSHHPKRVVVASCTALLAVGLLPALAHGGPVSNVVSDLVVTAETEGVQLPFIPAIESDFQRDTGFLDDPGETDVLVSSLVALEAASADAESSAGLSYTTDDDSATFFYSLEGFAFASINSAGNDFGASSAFSAEIETAFTVDQSVEYVFTSAFEQTVSGADLSLELFEEGSGDLIDLGEGSATGELAEGRYIGLFSLTGDAATGDALSDFVDGAFSATLVLTPGAAGSTAVTQSSNNPRLGQLPVGNPVPPVTPLPPVDSTTPADPVGQPQPIPTPTALLAGMVGMGLMVIRRRRCDGRGGSA